MSGSLMGQIYQRKLTPAKREVLLAMAENAKDDGTDCKPGVPYIAWKVDLSDRQVQRIQKALVEDGILVIVEKPARKPIVYTINLDAAEKKPEYRTRDARKGDKLTSSKGDILSPMSVDEGDILSQNEGDNMSSEPLRVTSHGKDDAAKGDIGTGKTSSTHLKEEPLKDKEQQLARPRIYQLYEQLTGKLIGNTILANSLTDDAASYKSEWIEAAVEEAALNGAQTWNFVRAVLKRWEVEGFKAPRKALGGKTPPPLAPPKPPTPEIQTFDPQTWIRKEVAKGTFDPSVPPVLKGKAHVNP